MSLAIVLLAAVTFQRGAELMWAERNMRRLRARGAVERSSGHYVPLVAIHAAWLGGLWWFVGDATPNFGWLGAYALLQLGRAWVLLTLGERWTTRILVVPGEALVAAGPYRFMKHPNYAIVAGEIAILPLALGLPGFALVFSLLNALILTIRIRAENAALADG